MNKKAFTLIELLAVIIVLGVVLAIAVPNVTKLYESSQISLFETNANHILELLDKQMLEDRSFDPTIINESNIYNQLGIDVSNYKQIKVTKKNGNLMLSIVGKNKWANLSAYGSRGEVWAQKGAVVWLDATNSLSYNGTGTTWYDLSGYNNHCVFNSLPTYNTAYFTFNGTTNYGTITNNATLDFSKAQTLIMVLRHTFTSGRRNPWDQAYAGYGTWTHENGNTMSQYFGDGGANTTPYVGINSAMTNKNVWNIIGATRSTTEHRSYMNGQRTSITTHPYGELTPTSADIRIGRGYVGYWEGDMAYIIAYNRVLSDDEMLLVYNKLKVKLGI